MAQTLEVTERDYVMARLAAARAAAASSLSAIDEALQLFVDPDDDEDGSERAELIEVALESAGVCAKALEAAQAEMPNVDPEEIEPWEDGEDIESDDDEEGDDEDEDEPDQVITRDRRVVELPRATARKAKR